MFKNEKCFKFNCIMETGRKEKTSSTSHNLVLFVCCLFVCLIKVEIHL